MRAEENRKKESGSVERAVGLWKGSLEPAAVLESPGIAEQTRAGSAAKPVVPRGAARSGAGHVESLRSQGARPVGSCLAVGCWREDVEAHTTSHHEGEGSLHGLMAALSVDQAPRYKDLRVQSTPCLSWVFFPCFSLNECSGTVSISRTVVK